MKMKLSSKTKVLAAVFAVGLAALLYTNMGYVPDTNKLIDDAERVQQLIDSGSLTSPEAILELIKLKNIIIGIISSAKRPARCQQLLGWVPSLRSGFYPIYPTPIGVHDPTNNPSVHAWCEVNSEGTVAQTIWSSGPGKLSPLDIEATHSDLPTVSAIASEISAPKIILPTDAIWSSKVAAMLNLPDARPYLLGTKALIAYSGGSLTIEADVNNVSGRKIHGVPSIVRSANKVTVFSMQYQVSPSPTAQRGLIDAKTKRCIKDTGENRLVLTGCSSGTNQKFVLFNRGIVGGYFQIKNVATGTCLSPGLDSTGAVILRTRTCSTEANTSMNTIHQTWSFTYGNTMQIKSKRLGTCLEPATTGDGDVSDLTLKPCSAANTRWVDSARNPMIYEKSASLTSPAWTPWRAVSTNKVLALSTPAATITSSGRVFFSSSDGTTMSVYTQSPTTGNYSEFIRTELPFRFWLNNPMALAVVDMGDSNPALILGAWNDGPYFARFSLSEGYLTKWSDTRGYTTFPVGNYISMAEQMDLLGMGANLMRVRIPLSGTSKVYQVNINIKNDPGMCTTEKYASKFTGLTDRSIEALMIHYRDIGKAAGSCQPYLEKCSVKEYLRRRPVVLASDVYRNQAMRHWEDYGRKEGWCKPDIPTCTVQDFNRVRRIDERYHGYLSAYLEYYQWLNTAGVTAQTCYPVHSEKCAPSQYLARRPDVAAIPIYLENPGLHYARAGMSQGMCEPSLPEKCLEPFTTEDHVKLCMSISAEPILLTGDFYVRNASKLQYLKGTCIPNLIVGLPLPECLYTPDSWYIEGFPIDGPQNGPQAFVHETGYEWYFSNTDGDGCNSCVGYNAAVPCNAANLGVAMKYHQPGTNNNDYVYVCRRTAANP